MLQGGEFAHFATLAKAAQKSTSWAYELPMSADLQNQIVNDETKAGGHREVVRWPKARFDAHAAIATQRRSPRFLARSSRIIRICTTATNAMASSQSRFGQLLSVPRFR